MGAEVDREAYLDNRDGVEAEVEAEAGVEAAVGVEWGEEARAVAICKTNKQTTKSRCKTPRYKYRHFNALGCSAFCPLYAEHIDLYGTPQMKMQD